MQNFSTAMAVVAAALVDETGRILLHQRPFAKAHGGLWEFPGGKVESGETPESALIREIGEELGVTLCRDDLQWVARAGGPGDAVVIDLYKAVRWCGEPRCIEGEAIEWFDPDSLFKKAMPPLDVPLAQALCTHLNSAK